MIIKLMIHLHLFFQINHYLIVACFDKRVWIISSHTSARLCARSSGVRTTASGALAAVGGFALAGGGAAATAGGGGTDFIMAAGGGGGKGREGSGDSGRAAPACGDGAPPGTGGTGRSGRERPGEGGADGVRVARVPAPA